MSPFGLIATNRMVAAELIAKSAPTPHSAGLRERRWPSTSRPSAAKVAPSEPASASRCGVGRARVAVSGQPEDRRDARGAGLRQRHADQHQPAQHQVDPEQRAEQRHAEAAEDGVAEQEVRGEELAHAAASALHAAFRDDDRAVDAPGDRVDVVRHHPDREPPRRRAARASRSRIAALGLGIDAGGGLVEQQQLRIGRQRARQQHALALAARERGVAARGEVAGAGTPRAPRACASARARPPKRQKGRSRQLPVQRHLVAPRAGRAGRASRAAARSRCAGPAAARRGRRAAAGSRAARAAAWSSRCRSSRAAPRTRSAARRATPRAPPGVPRSRSPPLRAVSRGGPSVSSAGSPLHRSRPAPSGWPRSNRRTSVVPGSPPASVEIVATRAPVRSATVCASGSS